MRLDDEDLAQLYRVLDAKVYESESRGRKKTAHQHLKIVQQYRSPGRLLDVGCASGMFLRCAADAGWKVVGVEPARALYEKAKEALAGGGELICATLQEAGLSPSSFDVVTLWDVLEHTPDPLRFLCSCASLLRPGGHLFLNVPDLDSLQSRLLGLRWPLFLPEHLNYFDRKSLRLCGERAQLTWVHFGRRRASFSVEYVLYRLAQHRIPGASIGHRLASRTAIGRTLVSMFLGELYGVWRSEPRMTASSGHPESMQA